MKFPPVWMNPFNGKCIHGRSGAKMIGGRMVNSKCPICARTQGKIK